MQVGIQPLRAPLDYESIDFGAAWQDDIGWPVSHADINRSSVLLARNALEYLTTLTDEDQRVATQCMAILLNFGLPYVALGAAISNEQESGIHLTGSLAVADYLRGEVAELPQEQNFEDVFLDPARIDRPLGRRLARTSSLNTSLPFLKALVAPDAVAVTHNNLLVETAMNTSKAIGFYHIDVMLREALSRSPAPVPVEKCSALAADMCGFILKNTELARDIHDRVLALMVRKATRLVSVAHQTLSAFAGMSNLPGELWSATGGHWAARALGLEVIRRGGVVRRFEHGSEAGMIDVVEPIALTELVVSTHFVLPTRRMKENLEKTRARSLLPDSRPIVFEHGNGDPKIRALMQRRQERRPAAKPRLLYGPTILTGFRALVPPLLPDPVHIDWQFRLVRQLQGLNVDLILRPHPESYPLGQPHRLSELAPLDSRPYEACLSDADVFLFDYEQSTTFYEALCTDRPVVLIDFGNALFTEEVKTLLEKRCRIVKATFDDRNRPQIDWDELEAAIMDTASSASGVEFRSLILDSNA